LSSEVITQTSIFCEVHVQNDKDCFAVCTLNVIFVEDFHNLLDFSFCTFNNILSTTDTLIVFFRAIKMEENHVP